MWSLHSSTGIADKSEARRGAPRSRGVMGWSVCPDRAPPSPLPGTLARSAPQLAESSTTRRSTAAAEPILAGVTPSGPPLEDPTGAQILRHLPAHGCSAIFDLRPSSWRSSDPPRSGASSSTAQVTATPSSRRRVAASTPASTPFVLALRTAGAACVTPGSPSSAQLHSSPHLWCVALRSWKKQASREVLTGRSTSSPDRCLIFGPSPDIRQCRMVSSPGNSGPNIFEHTCG